MIKELTELVLLIEQALPNQEAQLNFFSRNNRDVLKLYHAVQANNFRTEAEAIEKAKVGERTKFRQIAKELLRCLEQMVLQIDLGKQVLDDLNQNRIRGFHLMAISKSLGALACKNGAKKTAEELVKIGQQYARPEFVVEAAKVLMDYVSVAGDDLKAFDSYLSLYEEYKKWRTVEERSFIYLNKNNLPYTKKKALQSENADFARRCIEELAQFVHVIPSHSFHLNFYCIKAKRFMMEARYQDASQVHDEAIAYFLSRPYPCNGTLSIFYYLELANCVHLAQYERGNAYFQRSLQLAFVGSVNWFNTLELGFYLRMHEQHYAGAAEIYATATKHKRFGILRDTHREVWHILGAYLFIVQRLTGAALPEGMLPKFKSSKFRNDIRNFSQDKAGMNIAILVAEVLLDFIDGKEEELWDRIAALEKYRERYLRNKEQTHRSQIFIKVLTIFSKYCHDSDKFLDKVGPYLHDMRTAPLPVSSQAHELEIIPYEHLVQMLAQAADIRWGLSSDNFSWLNFGPVKPNGRGLAAAGM